MSMAVATQSGISSVSVISRSSPSLVVRPVSAAPKLQLQRWGPATRRLAPLQAVRSVNSVARSLSLTNAGPWGRFAGLRVDRVCRRKELVKPKRTHRTVASAEARDGRVRGVWKFALGLLRRVVDSIRALLW